MYLPIVSTTAMITITTHIVSTSIRNIAPPTLDATTAALSVMSERNRIYCGNRSSVPSVRLCI